MVRALGEIWLFSKFAEEFGYSDVQSNYSRLYAWIANQLGHMAIGFFTALIFVWVADGATMAAQDCLQWTVTGALPGDWPAFGFTVLVLAAILVVPNLIWLKPVERAAALGHHMPVPDWTARALGVIFVIAASWALYQAGDAYLASMPTDLDAAADLGFLIATLLVGAIVLFLCKDAAFLGLAAVALIAVYLTATDGAGLAEERLWRVHIVLMAVFAIIAVIALVHPVFGYPAPKLGSAEKRVQLLVIAMVVGLYSVTIAQGLSPDWRDAVAASIAAVTLWWVKEFGADLPKVAAEIRDARARRPLRVTGAGAVLEKEYLDDARIDSRTDGMFYFSGAVIAAGVLSDEPLFSGFSWSSGVEIGGVLLFILILVLVGRVWAHRQTALDKIGVAHASRLAVFSSALRLGPAAEAGEAFQAIDDPISALGAFARAEGAAGRDFDHIIIFGRPGAGMTQLGRAVVSEAALASFSTAYGADQGDGAEGRTGRLIARNALIDQSAEILESGDLTFTPTIPLWAPLSKGDPVVDGRKPRPSKDYERRNPASVVAITDLREIGPYTPEDILANLSVAEGQQVLWLMQPRSDLSADPAGFDEAGAEAWSPDYEEVRHRVERVRTALHAATPGARIGVGFVARMRPVIHPCDTIGGQRSGAIP